MDQVCFHAGQPMALRVSTLPRGALNVTSPDVASDGSAERTQLVAYLLELAKDPVLREAVHVASESLSRSLDELESGRELTLKKLNSLAISFTRYALRMETRSTPFGLFAGVTIPTVAAIAAMDEGGAAGKSVGLDGQWLDETVSLWLSKPEIRRRLQVTANNLATVHDGRVRVTWPVPGAPHGPDGTAAQQETSIRMTPFVEWVLNEASAPVPYANLLDQAITRFDKFSESDIDGVLSQLTSHGFLLTSVTPGKNDADYWGRVTKSVAQETDGSRLGLSEWTEYEEAELGDGRAAWDRALARMRKISPDVTPQLRVETRMPHRVSLSPSVLREVEEYASSMWRIAPEVEPRPHLREYMDRFRDKYGTGAAVPLQELVDPHRGLGYPRGYRGSPWRGQDVVPTPTGERRALLGELVQESLATEQREIVLTDEVLEQISEDTRAHVPLPSMELCLQIVSHSTESIQNGDFRLLTSPFTGSWLSGASVARYGDLLQSAEKISSLVRSGSGSEQITAEVVFAPRVARALNVMQTPSAFLPYEIPLGVYADSRKRNVIDWRDLLVTATPSGLEITWSKTGKRVVPVVAHMLDMETGAPNLARLLNELSLSQVKPWYSWRWAGLEALPMLPRVTRGRTVVSPLRWKPTRHMRDATKNWADWNSALEEWRGRYRVPNEVRIVHSDRAYFLDLNDTWHRKIFRNELARGEISVFEDLTEGGKLLGWINGHSNELVVPLTSHVPQTSGVAAKTTEKRQTRSMTPHARKEFHLPGEEWVYAKFFALPDRQNTLIALHIPRLIKEVEPHIDCWFYMRFNDPEPHIRLRMRGRAHDLATHVLPALGRHARELRESGAISSLQLDTYEPEIQRYGGPSAISVAEELFNLDSQAAVAQIRWRLRNGGEAIPDEVLAAMNYAVFLESLGLWNWPSWVVRKFQLQPQHKFFQQHRRISTGLVVPGRAAEQLAEVIGLPGLQALWMDSPSAGVYGAIVGVNDADPDRTPLAEDTILSVLHMQHNRLIGINKEKEKRSYAVLRGVALAHTERMKRGIVSPRQ